MTASVHTLINRLIDRYRAGGISLEKILEYMYAMGWNDATETYIEDVLEEAVNEEIDNDTGRCSKERCKEDT